MNILEIIVSTVLSFVFLCIAFVPLEKAFPAKKHQPFFRPHWFLDLCFFLGQYFIWNSMVLMLLKHFGFWLNDFIPHGFREVIGSQSLWIQTIEVIVFSDLLIYWGHRLQHKVDFLWRFHKVHHTAEHLDWLAAHREHPIDTVYTVGLINLPAFLMGFSLNAIAALIAFRGFWAIYIHSNVRLHLPFLRKLIGSPELHHWHHDIERDRGNYSNLSPLMDIMFGTYTCPDAEPEKFGIKEKVPKSYLGNLFQPLLFWKK